MPGESKVGYSGEDEEGRLLVEDLQRGDISEVQSGEDWNQQWRKQLGDDGDGEAVVEALKIIKAQISILIHNQLKYSYDKVEGQGELGGEGVVGRRRG